MKTTDVYRILNIDEQFKAPTRVMELMWKKVEREKVFREFIAIDSDLSYDGFHEFFEDEQSDRKKMKQDFTPDSISKLLAKLTEYNSPNAKYSSMDPTAGTGGLIITKWWQDCLKYTPWEYHPHDHFYYCEELSERVIPFLLFNLCIRGMNAIVVHGDALSREKVKGVFFIQNTKDDALAFSDLNVMPYSDDIKNEFKITSWADEKDRYPTHIESVDYPKWMKYVDYTEEKTDA